MKALLSNDAPGNRGGTSIRGRYRTAGSPRERPAFYYLTEWD